MRNVLGSIFFFGVLSGGLAADETIGTFYQGKSVSIIVGSAPGGGFDTYARLLARHLGRHIPGAPIVTVQNLPGAGSNRAAAFLALQAPRDGTTIGALQAGAIMAPLISDQKVKHDASQFIMLGSANRSVYLCVVRSDAPVKTFEEAFRKELIIGTSSEGSTLRELPVLLVNVLGVRLRLVGGYAGSREITLAMERNEVHGMCGMDWSSLVTQRRDWLDTGFVRPLAQEDMAGHPDLNKLGVPLTVSFARTASERRVLEVVYSANAFGRPYVLPPAVPAERVDALRAAFLATLADDKFRTEAAKVQLDIDAISGAELQKIVKKLYQTPNDILRQVKKSLVYVPKQ